MKELKPKLIFADGKKRSSVVSLRSLVVILIAFCIGVYVGINLNDVGLGPAVPPEEAGDDKAAARLDGLEGQREDERSLVSAARDETQAPFASGAGKSVADSYSTTPAPESRFEGEISEGDSQEYDGVQQQAHIGEQGVFTVQVGAFREVEQAEKALAELNKSGYEAYVVPYISSVGSNWYLVRIGKFNTHQEAREYAVSFERAEGMEAIVESIE